MVRLIVVLTLIGFVGVGAQFLSLTKQLQGLLPQELQHVLSGLSENQIKLLKEVDREHKLGVRLVEAIDKLSKKVHQLPASASGEHVKDYYLLLANIKKSNQKEQVGRLLKGYEALKLEDRNQIKKVFPGVVSSLESPELHQLAGLPEPK